jgi:U3 small nucleolar RNA-associated protein 23
LEFFLIFCPVITQCSIRHLYAAKDNSEAIELAKSYERRRCNHHTLDNPLSTLECLQSVVDPKQNSTNKHRYTIASQDNIVRAHMRSIPGVPLVYINRSVMIMEPMAEVTETLKRKEEKTKFRAGLKPRTGGTVLGKRTRDLSEDHGKPTNVSQEPLSVSTDGAEVNKKRKRGPKGPNPLSIKKPKKRDEPRDTREPRILTSENRDSEMTVLAKAKRKRKPSSRMEMASSANAYD